MSTLTDGSLTAELRAVEQEYPGWHLFTSDTGRIWAVTTENHEGHSGSGTTLDAETPAGMRREIAAQVREWGCGAAA